MTGTILGLDEQGNNVEISLTDRLASMYILGKTGVGKSTLIENMLTQDIAQGMGACLIEPHRDLTEHIICRCDADRIDKKDIILLDPFDEEAFGLNIYDCPDITDPVMVGHTLNSVMDTFEKLYDMSRSTPQMAQVMRNLTLLLIHNPGMTILEIPLILTDKPFRSRLVANVPPRYQSFWKRYDTMSPHDQDELTRSSTNKIDEFINDPIGYYIFGQSHTSINFRSILDSGKVLLITLSTDFPLLTSLLGSILISQLLMASLSRKDIPENKRRYFNLYIDEFQNFATPSMNKLLTESRKYHLGSTVSHQTRNQLPESIQSTTLNTGSLVCFRLTSEDAEELAAEYNLDPAPAIRPSTTIPRNCLDYIDRHPNEKVREFSGKYIHRLQEALKVKENNMYLPSYNFGEEYVAYRMHEVQEVLQIMQTIFYDTMREGKQTIKEGRRFAEIMSNLLTFQYVYKRVYLKDYGIFNVTPEELEEKLKDKKYREEYEYMSERFEGDRQRYLRFVDPFLEVLDILAKEPIIATSTEHVEVTTQQTYADRKNQLANELVHLKRGHARVKLPGGEYLLTTIVPETNKKDLQVKKDRIIENTRKAYCKPRSVVEEEIRRRQEGDGPPPSITRKHPV